MLRRTLSLILLGAGVFLLVQVVMPVLAFKAWEVLSYDESQALVNPLPQKNEYDFQTIVGVSVEQRGNFPAIVSSKLQNAPYPEFKLSIPSIRIQGAYVLVNSNVFEQNLAHLPGTALPGEKGNVFISGHSSISSVIISSKAKALFVNLPRIKKGEEIIVEALGQKFTYRVMGLKVVDPKEISVINPPDSEGRYISLMTCVPPGFNTKRLIVLGKLVQ